MPETIHIPIGEHSFPLPPQPPKKDIAFHDLPKAEQYWRRSKVIADIPAFFFDWERGVQDNARETRYDGKRLISLSIADTNTLMQFRDREIQRMLDGFWFYNNGVPTYLTGGHYGILVWAAMDDCLNEVDPGSQYGAYFRFQRDYAYFIELCKTTKIACGGNVVKAKKTGITMFQNLLMLIDAITHRSANYRIMSTKEDIAKSVNMRYVLYAARRLPEILKPEYRNNLGAIYFVDTGKGAKMGGKKKTDVEHLETVIETVATVWNAFDSAKNKVCHVDEQSKIRLDNKKNLETLHNSTIATVMQGFLRIGYVIYTHYVSENNDDSFRMAKEIYYNSKLRTISPETGKTKSSLICFAITTMDGMFGACDKYGEPDQKLIWNKINGELAQKKDDPVALRSHRRQYPMCEDDCWIEGAGELSVFPNERLGAQLHKLKELTAVGVHSPTFNFKWTIPPEIDEFRNIARFPGSLKIVPVSHEDRANGAAPGMWTWYKPEWTPVEFMKKHTNLMLKDQKGNLRPNPASPFYISIDPTQYSGSKDVVVKSNNAMHVFILPSPELDALFAEKISNKRLMIEYHYRPDNPRDTLMHVIQTILFFSCYVLIECNAGWLATRLKELGLGNFLIQLNEETRILEPYNPYFKQKPFTSQKSVNGGVDTIEQYVTAGKVHLYDALIDNVEYIESEDVIKDLINFDPDNTRQFDSGVCYLIGLLGIATHLGWRQRELDKMSRKSSPDFLRMAQAICRG